MHILSTDVLCFTYSRFLLIRRVIRLGSQYSFFKARIAFFSLKLAPSSFTFLLSLHFHSFAVALSLTVLYTTTNSRTNTRIRVLTFSSSMSVTIIWSTLLSIF